MFHVAGFSGAVGVATNPNALPGLQDPVMVQSPQGPGYQFQQRYTLAAAAAMSATLVRAQITSPTLRQVQIPEIRPIIGAAIPPTTTFIQHWGQRGLILPQLEQVVPNVLVTAAGPEQATVLIWLMQQMDPVPPGPILTAHGTLTGTAVVNSWTNMPITFDQSLPTGMYSIVGMEAISAGLIAFRVVFPVGVYNSQMRPGSLGHQLATDLQDPWLADRSLGAWGQFLNTAPPSVDVLSSTADTAFQFWMQLIPTSGQQITTPV